MRAVTCGIAILVLCHCLSSPAFAQAKEVPAEIRGSVDGVLGGMKQDRTEFLGELDRIMASGSPDRSKTTDAWADAIERSVRKHEVRVAEARGSKLIAVVISRARQGIEGWNRLGKLIVNLPPGPPEELGEKGAEAVEWKRETDQATRDLRRSVKNAPKKMIMILNELREADEAVRSTGDALDRLDSAPMVDVEIERVRKVRILVSNTQRFLLSWKDRLDAWFDDNANRPPSRESGANRVNAWWNKAKADPDLDPAYVEAVRKWALECASSSKAYKRAFFDYLEAMAQIREETLLAELDSFAGRPFSELTAVVDDLLETLRAMR